MHHRTNTYNVFIDKIRFIRYLYKEKVEKRLNAETLQYDSVLLSLNCVLPCTKYLKLITYFKVKSYEHYPILASFNALGETLEEFFLMKLDLCLPSMLPF